YWAKVRYSYIWAENLFHGNIGYIQLDNIYFNADSYNEEWLYPFRENTVVGNRSAQFISYGIYLTTTQGKNHGYGDLRHLGIDITAGSEAVGKGVNLRYVSQMRLKEYPVFSPVSGEVIHSGLYGGYGNCVQIRSDSNYIILLGHLEFEPLVKVGEKVTPYTMLGIAGNTGRSSNYHLHLEVWFDKIATATEGTKTYLRNPVYFFQEKENFYNEGTKNNWSCRVIEDVAENKKKCILCGYAHYENPWEQFEEEV
ncbi:MAG: M23 family metallopeptidase, partial [Oscillospiraceae bacterium]|nr:M23 family metallopeptidase [Oscillospiraceae bacterium]